MCGSSVPAFPVASAAWLGTNPCPVRYPGIKFRCCSSGTAEVGNVKMVASSFAFACRCRTGAACYEVLGIGITNPLQGRIVGYLTDASFDLIASTEGRKLKCRDFIVTFSISRFASPDRIRSISLRYM